MMTAEPSFREQGLRAIAEGNLDQAFEALARAVVADDGDAEAKALLGVVYSQKGVHAVAKQALQAAVALQPQNANFQYNLGLALERSGDWQGAALAYREALLRNAGHTQARVRLEGMSPEARAWLASAPRPTAPVAAPAYSDAAVGAGPPPGTPSAPAWGAPAPPVTAGMGAASPIPAAPQAPLPVDEFSLGGAVRDWVQALFSPAAFFRGQVGREGLLEPMAFLFLVAVIGGVGFLVQLLVTAKGNAGGALAAGVMGALCLAVSLFLGQFVWAGIVHLACKLFGGPAGYGGTFRAVTYAAAAGLPVGLLVLALLGDPRLYQSAADTTRLALSAGPRPYLLAQGFGGPGESPGFPSTPPPPTGGLPPTPPAPPSGGFPGGPPNQFPGGPPGFPGGPPGMDGRDAMREQMRRQQEEMRERMQRQQDEMQSRMRRQQEEIQERIRQDQERMRRDMERMRERPTPPVLRNQPPDLERGIPATPRFSPRRPRLGAPNLPSTGRGADGAPFGRGGVRRPSLSPEAAGRVGLVLLLAALGWLWQQASTGIGLAHIHRFGAPASVGAVLVANLAGGVAAVVGVLTLGAFVGALAAAVLGGR